MARYNRNPQKKSNASGFFILAAIIALSIGIIGSYYQVRFKRNADAELFKSENTSERTLATEKVQAETQSALMQGGTPDETNYVVKDLKAVPLPAALPDLLASDASFRQALTAVSPGLAVSLNVDQLIRKFVVIANDIYQGIRVASHMSFLRLDHPFAIEQVDSVTVISERSYHRYDKLAQSIDVINPKALGLIYQAFRPLFLQVFSEFSHPQDITLETIVKKVSADILAAPIVEGRINLARPSVLYKFADNDLEALSPAQKQMLRMGPENTRIVQAKLREFMVEFAKLNFK